MDKNFSRLLDTLAVIPTNRVASTEEIANRLRARGHTVTARTVQRDLDALSAAYGIEKDARTKPYGWKWSNTKRGIALPAMEWGEALSFYLVRQYLNHLLPASVQQDLAPYFEQAEVRLATHSPNAPLQRWSAKIKIAPPGQPLHAPKVSRAVRDAVSEALLLDRQLRLRYTSRGKRSQMLTIDPLGLIQYGRMFYVVARIFNYPDVRLLALHRMQAATILDAAIPQTDGFDLDEWLKGEPLGFGGGGTVKLVADFFEEAGRHLLETPLSEDQTAHERNKSTLRIIATVADTPQLRWWLLGFGDRVEVVSPESLRVEIANKLKAAVRRYTNDRYGG